MAETHHTSKRPHQRGHTCEKPFKCNHAGCNAAFAHSGDLVKHERVHTGEKPYACNYEGCNAAFSQLGNLVIHKRVHSGIKPYTCNHEGCHAAFAQSGHLIAHKRIHTGERPFKCNHEGCNVAFTRSCHLIDHKRIHAGERPFKCNHKGCNAAFSNMSNLVTHNRIHNGDRPFRCNHEGCNAAFAQQGSLFTHKRTHTPEGQARQKKQEQRIARALEKAGHDFKREHHIDFTCVGDVDGSFARVDFLLIRHGCYIFLEVDESQHKFGYGFISCDMKRMSKIIESLMMEGNTMPLLFIRYNPDAFTVDGEKQHVKKTDRESKLIALLDNGDHELFVRAKKALITIQYMYYDVEADRPAVCYDPTYNASFRECVAPAIY